MVGCLRYNTDANLAEIISSAPALQVSSMGEARYCHASSNRHSFPGLLLMVWILKREVRAFGGCLGIYRR